MKAIYPFILGLLLSSHALIEEVLADKGDLQSFSSTFFEAVSSFQEAYLGFASSADSRIESDDADKKQRYDLAVTCEALGDSMVEKREFGKSIQYYQEAQSIYLSLEEYERAFVSMIGLSNSSIRVGDFETAENFHNLALGLVLCLDNGNHNPDLLQSIAALNYFKGNYQGSIQNLKLAFLHAQLIDSPDEQSLYHILNDLGYNYNYIGKWDSSAISHLAALEYAESIQDSSKIYYSLGNVFFQGGNFKRALENYQYSDRIFIENRDFEKHAWALKGIAESYLQMGEEELYLKNLFEAGALIKEKELKGLFSNSINFMISDYFSDQGLLDSAQVYHDRVWNSHKFGLNEYDDMMVKLHHADLLHQRGSHTAALEILKRIENAKPLKDNNVSYQYFLDLKWNVLESESRSGEAILVLLELKETIDSLNRIEVAKNAEEVAVKYEVAKNEKELIESKLLSQSLEIDRDRKTRQRDLIVLVSTILTLSLLVLILLLGNRSRIRRHKLKSANQLAEVVEKAAILEKQNLNLRIEQLEMMALQAQMNPHFIFNALASLQGYIMKQDFQQSEDYLQRFSKLIRATLENSKKKTVSLSEVIEYLESYLILEKMRLRGRLRYQIEVAPEVCLDLVKIPPMMIQPFIENAIIHGIGPRKAGGELSISFSMEEEVLEVGIIDDGIGRVKRGKQLSSFVDKPRSYGTKISIERLKRFNDLLVEPVEIIDRYSDQGEALGTEVRLHIASRQTELS